MFVEIKFDTIIVSSFYLERVITIKVYLVRHGQVNHNLYKKYSREDEHLNKTGIEQAEQLKEIIKDIDYELIISSPLIRAKHTAEIINFKNKKILIDERLKERDPGSLSGQSVDVTDRDEYWNYYSIIQYGTSENIQLFFERINNFLIDLKNQDYEKIIIVAHSGVTKAFNFYFNGINDGKFLNKGLSNCEIKEYDL